jgi:CheY-like chemotaxis protein
MRQKPGRDSGQGRTYDLILCDLRMPELDGPGFYRVLEERYPQLWRCVAFLTGDTLSPEAREFLETAGVARLFSRMHNGPDLALDGWCQRTHTHGRRTWTVTPASL